MNIVHASDLHFGPHYHADAGDAFLRIVSRLDPQLVVLSGDFTHRANRRQFQLARDYVGRLTTVQTLTTPGNHDVPLYSFWRRILSPYHEFRNAFGDNGDFVVHGAGFTAAVVDTTSPFLRITEGRLSRRQVTFLRSAFRDSTAALRIVVCHHPISKPSDWKYGRSVDPNRDALTAMVDEGVELVLGGHLHRSFAMEAAPGLYVIHSGTTTSTRGRSEERGMQTFNVIRVTEDAFDLEVFSFDAAAREFESLRRTRLPRRCQTPSAVFSPPVEKVGKAASGI
jgi:3',5'-cyclic AMP phosphodiesterase CpdA